MEDCLKAHEFSNNHIETLRWDAVCGCFYCCTIFTPEEIKEWIVESNPCDRNCTAICPYCGIDAVIGVSSGFPITQAFMESMHSYWF